MTHPALECIQELLKASKHVVILSGAGISAESGIATFRDVKNGHWVKHDPAVLSSMKGFTENPAIVWEWYLDRIEDTTKAQPNAAHLMLAELEKTHEVTIITQNVDDLHERAGSTNVVHLHGDLLSAKCLQGCLWHGPVAEVLVHPETPDAKRYCPSCGQLARPNVVWFGENLHDGVLERAEEAMKEAHVVFVIGTSGTVYPAAMLPRYARPEAVIISINTRSEDHSPIATFNLTGSSGDWMQKIVNLDK